MSAEQLPQDRNTEEAEKLKTIDKKVADHYSQPEENIPPADGNEHQDGLVMKDILEKRLKKD